MRFACLVSLSGDFRVVFAFGDVRVFFFLMLCCLFLLFSTSSHSLGSPSGTIRPVQKARSDSTLGFFETLWELFFETTCFFLKLFGN